MNWLKSILSEPDGTGSSTRVHASLQVLLILCLSASFGYLVHKHTVSLGEFGNWMTCAGTYLTMVTGSSYGINKLADWAKSKGNGQQPTNQQ